MTIQRSALAGALLLTGACTGAPGGQPIAVAAMHTTNGRLEQLDVFHARVNVPSMRAELMPPTAAGAELVFSYEGETTDTASLASGELRRQLGLKLLSFDTCNVTYVMWRLAPHAQIHVSQKSNPGQSRHEECGDRGYREVWKSDALPQVMPGGEHRLGARLSHDQLSVWVDGQVVWRGTVPLPAAIRVAPKIGVRSDNVRFRFALSAVAAGELP